MLPKSSVTVRLRAALVGLALVLGLVVANPAPAEAAPKAPSGLTRASYSNNAVRLTWKAVKGAAAYQVKYASNSKLKKASYVTVAAPVAEIGGLKASKNYYFKVKALKALQAMEATGGEPDVIGRHPEAEGFVFCDCAAESPAGRDRRAVAWAASGWRLPEISGSK